MGALGRSQAWVQFLEINGKDKMSSLIWNDLPGATTQWLRIVFALYDIVKVVFTLLHVRARRMGVASLPDCVVSRKEVLKMQCLGRLHTWTFRTKFWAILLLENRQTSCILQHFHAVRRKNTFSSQIKSAKNTGMGSIFTGRNGCFERVFFICFSSCSSLKKQGTGVVKDPIEFACPATWAISTSLVIPIFFLGLSFSRCVKTPPKLVAELNFCNFTLGTATQQKKTALARLWRFFFFFFSSLLAQLSELLPPVSVVAVHVLFHSRIEASIRLASTAQAFWLWHTSFQMRPDFV